MKKIILSLSAGLFALSASFALAQGLETITYPVSELGNCQNKEACKAYCEIKDNMSGCIDFGTKKGLVSNEEAAVAKKAIEKIRLGETPGKCRDRESCSNFCQNDAGSLKNCIAFAKEIGVPQREIDEAERVSKALEEGAKLPGNCQGKRACEAYCKNIEHIDECLSFAEAAGVLPPERLSEAKKIAKFYKSGEMPGRCTSKDECEAYCGDDSHFEECISFASKAELISGDEAEIARKTGGKGPGGCRSRAECDSYCNTEEHADECVNFAVEKGLVSGEDARNIRGGGGQIREALGNVPAETRPQVEACLRNIFGEKFEAILNGTQTIIKAEGEKIKLCFGGIGEIMRENAGQGQSEATRMNQGDMEKYLKGAPKDIQERIRAQMRESTDDVRTPPPSFGGGTGVKVPPVGIQGAPCSTPEECRAMFGGGTIPVPGVPPKVPSPAPLNPAMPANIPPPPIMVPFNVSSTTVMPPPINIPIPPATSLPAPLPPDTNGIPSGTPQ